MTEEEKEKKKKKDWSGRILVVGISYIHSVLKLFVTLEPACTPLSQTTVCYMLDKNIAVQCNKPMGTAPT